MARPGDLQAIGGIHRGGSGRDERHQALCVTQQKRDALWRILS